MRAAPDPALERACGIVAYKDSQPLRRALFRAKAARSPAIRAALATWERLGSVAARAAFVALYAAKSFSEVRLPSSDAALWAVWQYPNEARQIATLERLVPDLPFAHVTLDARTPAVSRSMGSAWELLARFARRGDFLVAARVASTVGYYLRMLPALRRSRARAVLVSSDANPCAMALVHAAESLELKTCFVAHGHVAERPPPLRFDLSLLDGALVREVYERAGPLRGEVVLRGVEGVTRPMSTTPLRRGLRTLGICGSILVDWPRAAAAIARLRQQLAPERVVLRLHPNRDMRDPRWADAIDREGLVVSDASRSLEEDAAGCELFACGNSSAHLTLLKLGVPSIYVPDLDALEDDYYRFAEMGIVPRVTADEPIDREAIAAFFESAAWATRFAHCDAAYPDRQDACDREVARALRALVRA